MDSRRGLVQRMERKLESAVEDAFARVFGGAVVPEEMETALRREAADGVRSLEGNQLLAPNDYVITLGVNDYANAGADHGLTAGAFARHLTGYIGEQGWQTYGDVIVRFEHSPNLHTGQVRVRSVVNPDAGPDASPHPTVSDPIPSQSDHAFTAEPGVSPMSDNPSYPGGQGQGRPGDDDYYDPRHGRQPDEPRAGQEPREAYPPESDPYPQEQRGGYPEQGGYPPPRRPEQGAYPDQGPGGYPPPYEQQRPPSGYGGPPGYDQGYPQQPPPPQQAPPQQPPAPPAGYPPAGGGQPVYGDYDRPPARHGDYAQPEQRPSYPDQGGGYDQSAPPYGRQDYGRADPPGYGEPPAAPSGYDYGQPPAGGGGGYGGAQGGYDYGQRPAGGGYGDAQPPAGGGYGDAQGGYGQRAYSAPAAVTLQLDDGSGRTYQLQEGPNVVGRGQEAQFRLPDTGVSRRHMEIRWDGRVALLSDLNSTNGTTVNNAPVQEWQLADGDVIRVGHSEIVVRVH
ncbi:MAG: FhaA domain-containing protein [Mycobacterium sp.]